MKVDSNYKDHIKEVWTNPGELTGVGQRMHYILGMRNRNRYIENFHFLKMGNMALFIREKKIIIF